MENKKNGVFVGIDFGTNNSCIAVYNSKFERTEILVDNNGSRIIPSYVFVDKDNKFHVGEGAKKYGYKQPERLLYDSKRLFAVNYNQICKQYQDIWIFETKSDPENGYCNYKIDRNIYTPKIIAAEVLKKLVSYVDEKIEGVVLTVPAYFSTEEKNKILEAAKMADLNVLQLICEPTAAAIGYGIEHSYINGETLFVFDMGGGTFDITIIKIINSKDFTVIALGGNSHLGGRDFDGVIVKWMLEKLEKQVGKVELTSRKKHKMTEMAKEAKETLSQLKDAVIELSEIHSDANDITLTRIDFEYLSLEIVEKIKNSIQNTLRSGSLKDQEIHHVLLAGGASKMPMISKLLNEFFNQRKIFKTSNAKEIVALGAARLAAKLGNQFENIYIGISALNNEAEVIIYNAVNFKQHTFDIKDFCFSFNNVTQMFEEIKKKIGEKLVNLKKISFCLDKNYGNNVRKTFIKVALDYGFENTYIIDYNTAQFVESMAYSNDIPKNDVTIWLFNGNLWNVWQITDNKASFMAELDKNFITYDNIDAVLEKYKTEKNILLFKGQIFDITALIAKFPNALFFTYPSQCSKNATILYCEMIAKNEMKINNVYMNEILVNAGREKITSLDSGVSLPLKKTIFHKTKNRNTILTVSQNQFEQQFVLPNPNNYIIELTVDNHGIYDLKAFEEISLQPLTAENNPTSTFPEKYKFPQKFVENDKSISAVGIDFGNTTCFVAVNRSNGIEIIPLGNTGERELLSYVSYDEMNYEKCGKVVVGRLQWHSKSTVFDFKKIIGKKFTDVEINENWPFKLINNHLLPKIEVYAFNGETKKMVETQKDPDEVLSELLKYMKKECENYQGKHLTETVITVPLSFNEKQIAEVKSAAFIAGWVRIHFLPDPIAAAFEYFEKGFITKDSTMLTFDLGGSSLQICVLKVSGNELQIIGHHVDINIGGKSFDAVVKNHIQNSLKLEYHHLNFENRQYQFDAECEEVKKDLSSMTQRIYVFVDLQQNVNKAVITIEQEELENLCQNLVTTIQDNINTALNNVNYKPDDIDMILQVGGGCRMPLIKRMLEEAFPNSEHCCTEHPEEVVAIGATHYAYDLISSSRI